LSPALEVPVGSLDYVLGGPNPRVDGYILHYPSDTSLNENSNPTAQPLVVTDALWSYSAPQPLFAYSDKQALPRPPLGPANQPGLYGNGLGPPREGVAISAGQLVAKDVIMCKYVYPPG
jgi:hypothetical protein